jgi:hypothetical protein
MTNPMTSDELKAAFAALDPMEPIEADHSWRFNCWDLRQNVAEKDPAEFLTWPGVVGTMFVGNAPYIEREVKSLMDMSFTSRQSYLDVIDEPGFGKPELLKKGKLVLSGNLIHQAYHISRWDGGWLPELETIIEIGGGYGAMALICHRLGFRGRYIIYDLPEFSLLQQYYLSNVGVDNVEFRTQIDNPTKCDLLIGLFSLSEMPINERWDILKACPAQSYLIAYQAAWGGRDNMAWASEMMRRKGYLWRNWNIPHLPNCWYLAGDKRK